jgi:hypothetical protein
MPNSISNTNAVWSTTEQDLGPCAACGDTYNVLSAEVRLEYTHCGGTGAICINSQTGTTCSTGTAPSIGDFPGAIRDFLWWGDGAYGLSANGDVVYALGTAQTPVFSITHRNGPPWTDLYAIGPDTIAVSASGGPTGYRVATAQVNSIATHTCC